MKKNPLKILIVAAEVAPYAKTGGLGDVAGSLPGALRACGVDARVVFPKYRTINGELLSGMKRLETFTAHLAWRSQYAAVCEVKDADGAPVYLIENDFISAGTTSTASATTSSVSRSSRRRASRCSRTSTSGRT